MKPPISTFAPSNDTFFLVLFDHTTKSRLCTDAGLFDAYHTTKSRVCTDAGLFDAYVLRVLGALGKTLYVGDLAHAAFMHDPIDGE